MIIQWASLPRLRDLPYRWPAPISRLQLAGNKDVTVRHGEALFYNNGPLPGAFAKAVEVYLHDKGKVVGGIEIWDQDLLAVLTRHDPRTEKPCQTLMVPERLLRCDAGLHTDRAGRAKLSLAGEYEGRGELSVGAFREALKKPFIHGRGKQERRILLDEYIHLFFLRHGLSGGAPGFYHEYHEMPGGMVETKRQKVIAVERAARIIGNRFTRVRQLTSAVLDKLLAGRVCLTVSDIQLAMIETGLARESERAYILPLLKLLNEHIDKVEAELTFPAEMRYLGSHASCSALNRCMSDAVLFSSWMNFLDMRDLIDRLLKQGVKFNLTLSDLQQQVARVSGVWIPASRFEIICGRSLFTEKT